MKKKKKKKKKKPPSRPADVIVLAPPPTDWRPLRIEPDPYPDVRRVCGLFAVGGARVKVAVHRAPAGMDETDAFPLETREWIEAGGAPNGLQMEYPLDQGSSDPEEVTLPGIHAMLWRLDGGSFVRTPPARGWGAGGEHVVAAALVVPEESRSLVLGGPPEAVKAAAPAFERWVRSARVPGRR